MRKNYFVIVVIVAVLFGFFIGHYFTGTKEKSQSLSTTEKNTKKPLYWIDSMEPTIHYKGPGKSRMGMELTPVYSDDNQGSDQSAVRISKIAANNMGVRTAVVIEGELSRRIETVGTVEPNENNISHIHTYADGWVKKLLVKSVGDVVKNHQIVLQLYSPTLVNVQEEYLIALGTKNQELIDASTKRLQAFHISSSQIAQLKATRKVSQLVDVYSHQAGVVQMLNVREGMHVTPDTEIMSIVDLSDVWIIAHVFEHQANWVKVGERAEAKLSAFPGKILKGTVEYIYPIVDATSRTLKVRFRFNNLDGLLKPNMYANITLWAPPKPNVISIPLEALIRSQQGDHVIVVLSDGRFQSRPIVVGMESGDRVEILSGLKPGEKVVTSGQFLIDSESNLKSGLDRLEAPAKK